MSDLSRNAGTRVTITATGKYVICTSSTDEYLAHEVDAAQASGLVWSKELAEAIEYDSPAQAAAMARCLSLNGLTLTLCEVHLLDGKAWLRSVIAYSEGRPRLPSK